MSAPICNRYQIAAYVYTNLQPLSNSSTCLHQSTTVIKISHICLHQSTTVIKIVTYVCTNLQSLSNSHICLHQSITILKTAMLYVCTLAKQAHIFAQISSVIKITTTIGINLKCVLQTHLTFNNVTVTTCLSARTVRRPLFLGSRTVQDLTCYGKDLMF